MAVAKFIYTGIALLCYQAAVSSALALRDDSRPTATVDSGVLVGTSTSAPTVASKVNKFLGIPFAKPPARWKLPEKPDSWQGSREATQFGNACNQQQSSGSKNSELLNRYFNSPPAAVPDSEDCLYLNVFAPLGPDARKDGKPLQTMVFFYGGEGEFGGVNAQYAQPQAWVERSSEHIVVVFK